MAVSFGLTATPNSVQDIYFVNGQLAIVDAQAYTAQRIRTRLQLFLGEWPFDTSQGVPWLEKVFIKPANLVTIQAIIKSTIINTPTVTALTSYSDNFSRLTRNYSVQFIATSDNGTIDDTVDLSTLMRGFKK